MTKQWLLSASWLAPDDIGPFEEPFRSYSEDFTRLQSWISLLYSGQSLSADLLHLIVETYAHIQQTNEYFFDVRPSAISSNPFLSLLEVDSRGLFSILRDECEISRPKTANDPAVDAFVRIMLYCKLNQIESRAGMSELLFPIFHVCYYGLWAGRRRLGIEFAYEIVEALAADCFVRFLTRPPFGYFVVFEKEKIGEKVVGVLEKKLEAFQVGYVAREVADSGVFRRWVQTLFVADLTAVQAIRFWEWMFVQAQKRPFVEAFCAFVAVVVADVRDLSLGSDAADLLEGLTELCSIDFDRVLVRAARI
jgi:hypothetical protein